MNSIMQTRLPSASRGRLNRAVLLAAAVLGAGSAHAVSFSNGDVTVDINGTVNGFYVNRTVESQNAAGTTLEKNTNSGISNGLLPGWINFVASGKVDGLDVKAHFGFAPGINNNSNVVGLPTNAIPGLGNPYTQIDTRNVYFQVSSSDWGSVKFGRDIGLFGQNVILSDMTLLGVGGTSNAATPFNTTFGMIAHGYMYTGFQPQITYTTPSMNGLQASAGIFQPVQFSANQSNSPGFQAMASYDWKGSTSGKVWTGVVTQSTQCADKSVTACATKGTNANGFELGGKVGVGALELVGYGFSGKGLGLSTVGAQFFGSSDALGNKTDAKGYFLQATYALGKTKLGVNFGENTDKGGAIGAGVERKNRAFTIGAYHSLNKFVTLVAEINRENVTGFLSDGINPTSSKAENTTVSIGGILFF